MRADGGTARQPPGVLDDPWSPVTPANDREMPQGAASSCAGQDAVASAAMNVLDEVWRVGIGGVVAGDGATLLEILHNDARAMARTRVAVLGKRALVLLLQASTCPTCAGPMSDHVRGCEMGILLAEVEAASASGGR